MNRRIRTDLRSLAWPFAPLPFVAAALGLALSVGAAPAIITWLAGERSLARVFAAVGRDLPAMAVQTIYGLLLRAVCTGLAALPLAGLGPSGLSNALLLALALLLGGFPILVLDRARVAVVLDDERRFHPMTFLRAIAHVATRLQRFPKTTEYDRQGAHDRGNLINRFGSTWKHVETRYRNWLYQSYPVVEQALRTAPSGGALLSTSDLLRLTAPADKARRQAAQPW